MQSGVSSISTSHTNSGVHGRAKAMELSLVREVLSWLIAYASAALSKWIVKGGKFKQGDISFADACRAAAKEWREKRIIEGRSSVDRNCRLKSMSNSGGLIPAPSVAWHLWKRAN